MYGLTGMDNVGEMTRGSPSASTSASTSTSTSASPVKTPGTDDVLGPSSCSGCFDGTESTGSKAAVQQLQVLLVGLGLLEAGSTSGYYGNDTYAAVVEFQKRAYPSDPSQWDGRAGDGTKKAIETAYDTLKKQAQAQASPGSTALVPTAAPTQEQITNAIQDSVKIYNKPWFWPAIVGSSVASIGLFLWWRSKK